MRIAITGGSGRLGQYVVRALAGHDLRVLDPAPSTEPVGDVRSIDLRDLAALTAALEGIERVVHLGAVDRSVATDDERTMQVNAMGSWNLFEASRLAGVRRVVHCSSSSVTGIDQTNPAVPPRYLPIDEAHPLFATDAYGLSKLCGEKIAEAYARRGLEVIVLRPCFVAFPDLHAFMAGHASPAGRDEPTPILRAYIGPEDCARAFAAAVTMAGYSGFDVMFLAADDAFSDQPTVARVEATYGTQIHLLDPSLYAGFPNASPVSSARARRRLGWRPTTRWSGTALDTVSV